MPKKTINFRFSEETHELLIGKAEAAGVTRTQWLENTICETYRLAQDSEPAVLVLDGDSSRDVNVGDPNGSSLFLCARVPAEALDDLENEWRDVRDRGETPNYMADYMAKADVFVSERVENVSLANSDEMNLLGSVIFDAFSDLFRTGKHRLPEDAR